MTTKDRRRYRAIIKAKAETLIGLQAWLGCSIHEKLSSLDSEEAIIDRMPVRGCQQRYRRDEANRLVIERHRAFEERLGRATLHTFRFCLENEKMLPLGLRQLLFGGRDRK